MNQEHLTQLLQDLVRIPSVNPHGDPGTSAANTGEKQMVDYLAEFLRKLALDVDLQEVEPGRANLIAKFTSRGSQRSVAFAPHTDTVSVAGMTIEPFGGEVRDGKLRGRGATDTKGSIAVMLAGLANAVRQKSFREGKLDVYFCALMGEESGNDGARALMKRGFKVDLAIAGEPTNCRVVHAHKGALWFKLITQGKSVHGSMPDKGESAIKKMAEVVRFLLGDYTHPLKLIDGKQLGSPTVNVGVIRGGSQTNIVPDRCEIEVDRRTVSGENHQQILSEIRDHFQRLPVQTTVIRNCHPLDTNPEFQLVRQLARATGLKSPLTVAPWFCDAGVFAEHGIPAVAFGPGNVAQAHTADEWIALDEVAVAAGMVEKFLLAGA